MFFVLLAVWAGSFGVFVLVVPVGFLSNVSVDLEGILWDSHLRWFNEESDISGSVKNIEKIDLQVAVSILVSQEEHVLLLLNEANNFGDVSVLDSVNIRWDTFKVVWALVTDFVELLSEGLVGNCGKFNKLFLFIVFIVFVDTGKDIVKSVLSVDAVLCDMFGCSNKVIESLQELFSEIVGKIDIT